MAIIAMMGLRYQPLSCLFRSMLPVVRCLC